MFFVIKRKTILLILIVILVIFISLGLVYSNMHTTNLPVSEKVIVIDPGHGGDDPGAIGTMGKNEKEINLEIAVKLKALLEQSGYTVVLTRDQDESLHDQGAKNKKRSDLKNRKKIIEQANPRIFISIHLNSFPQKKYYGAQVFYARNSEQSKILGEIIQSELKNIVDNSNNRKAKSNENIFLLKNHDVPAVLVECGFLSNDNEQKLLNTNEHQQKIAQATLSGIIKYLSTPQTGIN